MRFITAIICFICVSPFLGQDKGVWMHPNKGQWNDQILYKVDLDYGEMYVEKDQFTFALNDFKQKMAHNHSNQKKSRISENKVIQSHIIKSTFIHSSWKGKVQESEVSTFYRNYFQGNDTSKWKSKVISFQLIQLNEFYPNIDLVLDSKADHFKYSFLVKPNTDPGIIEYEIKGAYSVKLSENGNLLIETVFGNIIEEKPIAWTISSETKKEVLIKFKLNDNKVSFELPKGYNHDETLIIDPSLLFSTFSGSTADNWGMTATPDTQGNLLAGGIVFNDGGVYPVTVGAFNTTINGGDSYVFGSVIQGFDIAISKFNSTGTQLLYATYLGGTSNEAPHSLVTNENGDLFIMGVTASTNFPMSSSAFDNSFNGGPDILENELFYKGTDIFVSKLSQDGSQLLGSTYVGGTGTDGVNIGDLNYNYGDPFRGEIIEGADGYIYVSSTTQSTDFPTENASQSQLKGSQDAVVFKLKSDLSSIAWSSYFGGSGLETGNSIQKSSNGSLYVAGGTTSNDLPFLIGNDLTYNGGLGDGYVMRLANSSGNILQGSYMGLNEYDQAYFVQLDINNDVYVYGQTESSWPITAGKYGNPNSGQFIRRYNQSLTSIVWTTMVGAGTGNPEISPTAFLVSNCNDIYISGWGGKVNTENSQYAHNSTTIGFPITGDAFQSLTNGDNFYIAVLGNDASTLKYGTYMGGVNGSYNHVDGGTSRFDKSGRIYHAVCGGCGKNLNGFTTTPGVYSPQNLGSNCNLAAFKFELNISTPIIGIADSVICLPDSLKFRNSIANGNAFLWDFGDGTISRSLNPTHLYAKTGKYLIKLVVQDTVFCYVKDSFYFQARVIKFSPSVVTPVNPICPNTPYQLSASGGTKYSWAPAIYLDNPLISNPIAKIDSTITFHVIVSDECGSGNYSLLLAVFDNTYQILNDTSICIGENVQLLASGGVNYSWTPNISLNNSLIANPTASPIVSTNYSVTINTVNNCKIKDSIFVKVFNFPPSPILKDSVKTCRYSSIQLIADGAERYKWSPNQDITSITNDTVSVNPLNSITYYCDFINACGVTKDSIYVDILIPVITPAKDTSICPNKLAKLYANGGVKYDWYFNTAFLGTTMLDSFVVFPTETSNYIVIGTDINNCKDTASMNVILFVPIQIQACPTIYTLQGDLVELSTINTPIGKYTWSPNMYLSCEVCPKTFANPDKDFIYKITLIDTNECESSDNVQIKYDGLIYVPNTFTPDAPINNIFIPKGGNIGSFEMSVFDRWGSIVFTSNSFDQGWDGTFKGVKCQVGTYTWKILFGDYNHNKKELVGHINLIR